MPLTPESFERTDLSRLAMIIDRDGIDVLVRRVVGAEPSLYARIDLPHSSASRAARIEEALYSNPLLLQPFRHVDVAMRSADAMIAPAGTDADAVGTLLGMDNDVSGFSATVDQHNDAVYFVDRSTVNFLSRTFDTTPRHVLPTLAAYFGPRSRSGNTAKMYVELTPQGNIEIAAFNSLGLAAARSGRFLDIDDAAYRVLAIFRQAALDPEGAEVQIAGPADSRRQLMARLSSFIRHVMPAIPPAGAYQGDVQAFRAPLSLLILCLNDENNTR